MNIKKHALALVLAICAGLAFADAVTVPTVSGVTLAQTGSRKMTITYTLSNGPAVVTLDIQTNYVNAAEETCWVSIGGEHIQRVSFASDVFKIVTGDTVHTIKWEPDLDFPGHAIAAGGIRAVVTAWALDNKPDYMVVDLANPSVGGEFYYPAVEYLPGGLLANIAYRTSKLVMRKIDAKNVKWTMSAYGESGRNKDSEKLHDVTLTNNYYIGVFEFTQSQYTMFFKDQYGNPTWPNCSYTGDGSSESRACLPMENSTSSAIMGRNNWSDTPSDSSLIGKIRAATGLDFDLPSEAQWEYACRAGHGEGYWGTGLPILGTNPDANLQACYNGNPSHPVAVGSYLPNSWGLYDMSGNVGEYVLDFFAYNISANTQGEIQERTDNELRVIKGGWYASTAGDCRPARRVGYNYGWTSGYYGFRLACRAGLK